MHRQLATDCDPISLSGSKTLTFGTLSFGFSFSLQTAAPSLSASVSANVFGMSLTFAGAMSAAGFAFSTAISATEQLGTLVKAIAQQLVGSPSQFLLDIASDFMEGTTLGATFRIVGFDFQLCADFSLNTKSWSVCTPAPSTLAALLPTSTRTIPVALLGPLNAQFPDFNVGSALPTWVVTILGTQWTLLQPGALNLPIKAQASLKMVGAQVNFAMKVQASYTIPDITVDLSSVLSDRIKEVATTQGIPLSKTFASRTVAVDYEETFGATFSAINVCEKLNLAAIKFSIPYPTGVTPAYETRSCAGYTTKATCQGTTGQCAYAGNTVSCSGIGFAACGALAALGSCSLSYWGVCSGSYVSDLDGTCSGTYQAPTGAFTLSLSQTTTTSVADLLGDKCTVGWDPANNRRRASTDENAAEAVQRQLGDSVPNHDIGAVRDWTTHYELPSKISATAFATVQQSYARGDGLDITDLQEIEPSLAEAKAWHALMLRIGGH